MGGEFGGEWIHVYVGLSPFAVHKKLSQHCELVIRQYKIKSFKKKERAWPEDKEKLANVMKIWHLWEEREKEGKLGGRTLRLLCCLKKIHIPGQTPPILCQAGMAWLWNSGHAQSLAALAERGLGWVWPRCEVMMDLRVWGLQEACWDTLSLWRSELHTYNPAPLAMAYFWSNS